MISRRFCKGILVLTLLLESKGMGQADNPSGPLLCEGVP
jgi:hypothetical protein